MNKFRGIIYKTTNLKTEKGYVGQQRNINGETINEYLGSGELLLSDIKKYGRENFKKIILVDRFFKNKEELNKLEKNFIISENTLYPNGYNKTLCTWPPDSKACKRGGKIGGKIGAEVCRKRRIGAFFF